MTDKHTDPTEVLIIRDHSVIIDLINQIIHFQINKLLKKFNVSCKVVPVYRFNVSCKTGSTNKDPIDALFEGSLISIELCQLKEKPIIIHVKSHIV